MRILVVDDEYVSRTKLKVLLQAYGDVDAVPSGGIALQMVERAREEGVPYRLVTMDVNMPDMSGQEAVGRIRQMEGTDPQACKILMVTIADDSKEIMSAFREGAEWYLVKPVTPAKLTEALEKLDMKPSGGSGCTTSGAIDPSRLPAAWRTSKPEPAPPAKVIQATRNPAPAAGPCACESVAAKPQPAQPMLVEFPPVESLTFEQVDPEFWEEYSTSTATKLEELEAEALAVEADPSCDEVQSVMRTLHSLKGEAGMIGMMEVQRICHETETVFKEADDKGLVVETVLRAKDWITEALGRAVDSGAVEGS
jgi:two-component system chemotaxis response regulator CheY